MKECGQAAGANDRRRRIGCARSLLLKTSTSTVRKRRRGDFVRAALMHVRPIHPLTRTGLFRQGLCKSLPSVSLRSTSSLAGVGIELEPKGHWSRSGLAWPRVML